MTNLVKLFSVAVLALLFILPSCKRYCGPVPHPPHHDTTVCQVSQLRVYGLYEWQRYAVSYNAHGNPVSMLIDSINANATAGLQYYYHYDGQDRLSDFQLVGLIDPGVAVWHKYVYAQPDYIVDTIMNFNVEDPSTLPAVNGPRPNAADAYRYSIAGYTLDTHGRIVQVWSIPNDPSQPRTLFQSFSYDANGDRVPTNPADYYDDKINPYQTNKVWQFLNRDYSLHNRIISGSAYTDVYNEYGLPIGLQNLDADFQSVQYFGVNNFAPYIDISYACSMPHGPVDY